MTCTCCTTPNAGPRCRCWPITCRPGRGWRSLGGPSRRCGWRGCAPRARSWRSAPVTCRSPARRPPRCCAPPRWHSARTTWRSCMSGPRGGRPGCTWRRCTYGKATRSGGGGFVRRGRPVRQRVRGVGVPGPDPQPQRVFLTRTAVLERMSGPLCEAVLDQPGSGATLAELARVEPAAGAAGPAGTVVPLPPPVPRHAAGRPGTLEPGLIPVLRRRAAAWYLQQRPARGGAGVLHRGRGRRRRPLAWWRELWLSTYRQGRITTLQRWYPVAGGPGRDRGTPDARLPGRGARRERWGGRSRPSGGPTRSIAGMTGTRPGPMTLSPRRGPPRSGPVVPARGRADARRRRRGRTQVRGGGHRGAVAAADGKGSRASFPVTSMAATRLLADAASARGGGRCTIETLAADAVRTVAAGDGAR